MRNRTISVPTFMCKEKFFSFSWHRIELMAVHTHSHYPQHISWKSWKVCIQSYRLNRNACNTICNVLFSFVYLLLVCTTRCIAQCTSGCACTLCSMTFSDTMLTVQHCFTPREVFFFFSFFVRFQKVNLKGVLSWCFRKIQ